MMVSVMHDTGNIFARSEVCMICSELMGPNWADRRMDGQLYIIIWCNGPYRKNI